MLKRLRTRILRSLARLAAMLANSLAVLARALENRLTAIQAGDPDAPVDEVVAEVITQPPQAATADVSIRPDVSTTLAEVSAAPVVPVPQPQTAQHTEPGRQQTMQTTSAQTKSTSRDDGSAAGQVEIRGSVPAMGATAGHSEPDAARMAATVSEVIPPLLPEAATATVQLSGYEQAAIDSVPQIDTNRNEARSLHTHKPASRAADAAIENKILEPAAELQSEPYADVSGLPPPLNKVVTLDLDARHATVPDFSGSVAAGSNAAGIAPATAVPEELQFAAWCTAKSVAVEQPRSDQACPWPELLPAADSTPPSQHLQWPFALEQKLRAVQHVRDMTHEQAGKVWNA